MSYITARQNKKQERIEVIERINGKRVFNSYPIDYTFYIDDQNGSYRSIYNTPLSKITPKSSGEFYKELAALKGTDKKVWESDLNLTFKCLAENYKGSPAPDLHIAFFDLEVDFDNGPKGKGYATIDDPFNKITAITIDLTWLGKLITVAIPPPTISFETAQSIAEKFENTFVFQNEVDMINTALDLLEDSDVISGWNSEGFDIPYLVNRIKRVMSNDDTRRLCELSWNEKPKVKVVEKYGKEFKTYDLVGKIHLDLMDLYRKYTYEERHSYSLNAIAEYELGSSKTAYEGSLDDLYNNDFETFIKYNRQDVQLLAQIENKLKFIALVNALAHDCTVELTTCMGTVARTDQAITNRAHDLGMVVPNKKKYHQLDDGEAAVGAYVADPHVGIHEWLGVIDINSLYPSTIRALNMGIETIVGQLRPTLTEAFIEEKLKQKNMTYSHAWEGQFGSQEYQAVMDRKSGVDIIIDWEENGQSDTLTASQIYDIIFNSDQKWMLSGNGTIFRYDQEAIIPGLLAKWYAERKEFQAKQSALILSLNNITDPNNRQKVIAESEYYDRLQHTKKIVLNSLYGALLNSASRFFDKRVGQSVTLTGRGIVRHQSSFVNECITGEYNYLGRAIHYGDTDSTQFSAWPVMKELVDSGQVEWNRDIVVQLYLKIGEQVNDSYAEYMTKSYNCPDRYANLIKSSCESVGYRGLYITKKRYAILNYFKDGKFYDDDHLKLKAMGLDLRRSDTPEVCQKFLSEILMDLLQGKTVADLTTKINIFKDKFKMLPLHEQGTPKRVNKLTFYAEQIAQGKGNRVPGHVRAAINWNSLRKMNNDNVHTRIVDGMKCIVVQLKENQLNMTSVAYPTDEAHLPEWFTRLPFDGESQVASLVDKKIENLLGKLPMWKEIVEGTRKENTFSDFFE